MKFLKKLFSSKKFLAMLSGILIVTVNLAAGLDLPPDALVSVLGVIGAFIVGQGIADNGKEAVLAATPPDPK